MRYEKVVLNLRKHMIDLYQKGVKVKEIGKMVGFSRKTI